MKNILFLFLLTLAFSIDVFSSSLKERIEFSSVKKGEELLSKKDTYTRGLSRFDIEYGMQKEKSTRKEYLNFVAKQSLEWKPDEKQKILQIICFLDSMIEVQKLNLPFPKKINFVKTTGKEVVGAAGYTRGDTVFLIERFLPEGLERRVIHELFHILTRNNPAFRKRLYAVIDFKITPKIPFPKEIYDLKFTNTDAPVINSYVMLKIGNDSIPCVMALYASGHYHGGRIGEYLQVGFFPIKDNKIIIKNGKPVVYSSTDVSGFFEKVGLNTNYAIDPEEALADNFVFVITKKTDLQSPEIVERMRIEMQK